MKRIIALVSILLGCFLVGFSESDSEPTVITQDIENPPFEDCVLLGKNYDPGCPADQAGCKPTSVDWHCPDSYENQGCSISKVGI